MSFKICSIGCGRIATDQHGPSYVHYAREHSDTQLVACCDIDEAKAIAFSNHFGFARHYTDYIQMLCAERPDAVTLNVPYTVTCELACGIMTLGYPLILEKPPGCTVEEIDHLIGTIDACYVPNQVAFNRRHVPLVRRLKRLMAEHIEAGQLQHIRYEFTRVGRNDNDFSTTAIHGIDTARHLAGSDYQFIRFRYQEFPDLGPTTANIFMDGQFTSGATVHLSFCPVTGAATERVAVYAHEHAFFLKIPIQDGLDVPGHLMHVCQDKVQIDLAGDPDSSTEPFMMSGFYGENAAFFDALRQGHRPEDDLRSSRQAVVIAQYLRERKPEYCLDDCYGKKT